MAFHSFRHRRPKAPKPPKPLKVKKPSTSVLKKLYKDFLSVNLGQRIAVLNQVMQWYDQHGLPYILFSNKGSYTVEQAKAMDIASKCRLKGMGTHSNDEKETAYRQAIKRYEGICRPLDPPLLETYVQQFNQDEDKLKLKQQKLEERWGNIPLLLTTALKPVNIGGQPIEIIVGHIKDPFKMDPERSQFTLRRDVVKELKHKVRHEGLLPVVDEIVETLSRMCALKPEEDQAGNRTGKYIMTHQDRWEAAKRMRKNFYEYAKSPEAPKRLVKVQVPALGLSSKPSKKGNAGNLKRGGVRVADAFVQGTIIAGLFLSLVDQKAHKYEELRGVINGNQSTLLSKLRWIEGVGQRKAAVGQGWSMAFGDETVTLTFGDQVYAQQVQASATATAPAHP